MDRKKRRVTYVTGANATLNGYGVKGNKNNKGGKKKKSLTDMIRRVIAVLALVVMVVIVISYASQGGGREGIGRVTRIGATLSQNVTPFGSSVIFYDGTTLHCVAATGGNEWSYQIGSNADYDATEEKIVAWSGNDLYILDKKGHLIYNNKITEKKRLSDKIQFASAGDEYVAAFMGEPDNGVISVINAAGQIVDNITVSNQTLLDIGFFHAVTSSSTKATELMWTMALDTTGTVISTEMQTFQPGKLATGKRTLGEHIAYMIYETDGLLNVVNTREIMHFNYRALEERNSTLIYGYTLEDVKKNGKLTYQLLIPAQEKNEGIRINNVRLMYGNVDRVMHLPVECMSAKLGTNSVYAFSSNAVYVCRFGETTFVPYSMPVNVTAVLGMITENRAVIASGSEIYVVELPG